MRVLITGGAGFIGSHLAECLLASGDRVLVLDDLSTGARANLTALAGHDRFEFRLGSVKDPSLVARLVERSDATVHLAAAVGVRLIVERPVHTIDTNVHGAAVVLDAAARARKLVVVASSSEVYGKSDKTPFREDDDLVLGTTTRARWAYACSKALDEWLAMAYATEKGVPVIVTRFFNTVGPRQTGHYGMVLPTFARQAVRGEPITVFGSGKQSRCFADVREVAAAVRGLILDERAVGEVFNVGSDREITIESLARRVKQIAGSSSPIVKIPYEEAYGPGFEDMTRRVPALDKLQQVVGFKPSRPLHGIIQEVVREQRDRAGGQEPPRGSRSR